MKGIPADSILTTADVAAEMIAVVLITEGVSKGTVIGIAREDAAAILIFIDYIRKLFTLILQNDKIIMCEIHNG